MTKPTMLWVRTPPIAFIIAALLSGHTWAGQPNINARKSMVVAKTMKKASRSSQPVRLTTRIQRHPVVLRKVMVRPPHGFESLKLPDVDGHPNNRDVIVYLPNSYGIDPNRHYPVMYMQDGQNLFEYGPAGFGNGWEVAKGMEFEVTAGRAEPAIIVAISNTPDRINEYGTVRRNISRGTSSFQAGGGADAYVDYVAHVVRPHIENTYLVRRGRYATAIGGSSMGGLVAVHAAIRHPHVFGKVMGKSASLWFDKGIIDRAKHSLKDTHVYIDNGGMGAEGDNAPHVARLRDVLFAAQKNGSGKTWHWYEQSAGHNESAWRDRFPRAFSALFPAP